MALPARISNRFGWPTNFNGISLTLDYLRRRPPNTNSSWSSHELSEARFTIRGLTHDMHLDLLVARTDNGTTLECPSWGSSGTSRNYNFRNIPLGAKTVDFTFALQRSRWVEFVVRPEIGPARLEYKP